MTTTDDSQPHTTQVPPTQTNTPSDTGFDPVAFLADIEKAWQTRNGAAAAAGYADDAVLIYANGRERREEELREWPARWFAYAKDLEIHKKFRAYTGDCVASEWESRYTHPDTGEPICERGAEFFFVRPNGKVYLHHMYEHTWVDGKTEESPWPAASQL